MVKPRTGLSTFLDVGSLGGITNVSAKEGAGINNCVAIRKKDRINNLTGQRAGLDISAIMYLV